MVTCYLRGGVGGEGRQYSNEETGTFFSSDLGLSERISIA